MRKAYYFTRDWSIVNKEITLEDLNLFCKHVGKCPVRSDDVLAERFSCSLCGSVVRHNQTFKAHLMKCQPPDMRANPTRLPCSEDLKKMLTKSKDVRERGKQS